MEGKSQPSKSRSKQLSLEINTPPPVQCIESPEKEQGFNGQEHYMDIASNENGEELTADGCMKAEQRQQSVIHVNYADYRK